MTVATAMEQRDEAIILSSVPQVFKCLEQLEPLLKEIDSTFICVPYHPEYKDAVYLSREVLNTLKFRLEGVYQQCLQNKPQ